MAGFYYGGLKFYEDKFLMNVFINDVNIGNLTKAEAKEKLTNYITNQSIKITEDEQSKGEIVIDHLDPTIQIDEIVESLMDQQDINQWPLSVVNPQKQQVEMDKLVDFKEHNLTSLLKKQGIVNEGRNKPTLNSLDYSDKKGFFIKKGEPGNTINHSQLFDNLKASLSKENVELKLEDNYETSDSVSDMPLLTQQEKALNSVLDGKADITYQIGDEEYRLDSELMKTWVYLDDNQNPAVDTEQMRTYLTELAAETATYDRERTFESTMQGKVTVPPGIMGAEIDVEKEIPQLTQDILEGGVIKRYPAFTGYGLKLGQEDEIGDTYVEVDLTNQMEFLYVDGQLILETPINSGKPVTPTTPGANVVIEMRTNTSLKGINPITKKKYSSPVVYWMRFDNYAQGIHDASWAPGFGGDTYTWGGSLGCINTPLWAAEQIYQNVELGTPVIVFY